MNRKVENILESIKEALVDIYGVEAEILYDIKVIRCSQADYDHWREGRIYAHVGCMDKTICVSSSIELLDDCNITGLLLHEIGHLIHLEGLLDIEIPDGINDDEIIADMIIDNIFGIHIYYDGKKVQWVINK
uniref:Peptidase n=1 Tax=viral metagenome TaxID=1070528 RepID=A0A6H1ZXL7_9ZZZZ